MRFHSALLSLLLLLATNAPAQSPADSFRRHYEAAERHHRAGRLDAAEAEFRAILAEAYPRLGRVHSARADRARSVAAFEAAAALAPDTPDTLVALAVEHFYAG